MGQEITESGQATYSTFVCHASILCASQLRTMYTSWGIAGSRRESLQATCALELGEEWDADVSYLVYVTAPPYPYSLIVMLAETRSSDVGN
jgi:NADH pyrophosphatase NudC (nudix superfamily)